MRVAVSGTHRTGKTSLIEALSAQRPAYRVLEEPYYALEEAGYELSDPPTIEDFDRQLRFSIESIAEAGPDVLVDRCPLDFIAYLHALDDELDVEELVADARDSLERLDLIVVVPIEIPDRIVVAAHEDRRLRIRVDERLRALALEDPYGLGTPVIEVSGRVDERVQQVLAAMKPR